MAEKQETKITIDAKLSPQAKKEIKLAKKEAKAIERAAQKAVKAQGQAQAAGRRGAAASRGGIPKGSTVGKSKGMFTFTGEGIMLGKVFKLSDQGFAVEGLLTNIGGPILAGAAIGRAVGGVLSGFVTARNLVQKGAGVGEAMLAASVSKAIDFTRIIITNTGVEKIGTTISALITGKSEEEIQKEISETIEAVKQAFAPTLKAIVEKEIAKKLKEAEEQRESDIANQSGAMLELWSKRGSNRTNYAKEVAGLIRFQIGQERSDRRAEIAGMIQTGGI